MKKVLALILAALMVTSCMMFTVAAEETYTGTTFVPVSDCDTTTGWTGSNVAVSAEKTQGTGSISTSFNGVTSGVSALRLQYDCAPVDISAMNTLVFDLYVSDVDAIRGVWWEFELRGVGGGDSNEMAFRGTLNALAAYKLQNGWNRVEIPIDSCTHMNTVGTFDRTQWNYFRMYSNEDSGVEYGTEGEDTVVAIDNMYFTSESMGTWNGTAVTFNDMRDTFAIQLNAKPVTHNATSAAKTLLFKSNKSNGWGRRVDGLAAYYDTVEFDLYIDNVAANDIEYVIGMTHQANWGTDNWQRSVKGTLSQIAGYELSVGWNHVSISIHKFQYNAHGDSTTTGGGGFPEFRNFFMWNVGGGTDATDVTVQVVDPYFSNSGTMTLTGFEKYFGNNSYYGYGQTKYPWSAGQFNGVGTNFSGEKASDANTYVSVGNALPGDISFVVANETTSGTLAADNYFRKVAGNSHSTRPAWLVTSDFEAVRFKVYVEGTNLQKDGAAITPADLDVRLLLYADAGSKTWESRRWVYTADLNKAVDLGNGWFEVTLPLHSYYLADTGDTYGLEYLYYIGFDGDAAANYGVSFDTLTVAFDDLAFVKNTDSDSRKLLNDFGGNGALGGAGSSVVWSPNFKGVGTNYSGAVGAVTSGKYQLASVSGAGALAGDNYFRTLLGNFPNQAFSKPANINYSTTNYPYWLTDESVESVQVDVCITADGLTKNGNPIDASELYLAVGLMADYKDNWGAARASAKLGDGKSLGNGWYRLTLPLTSFGSFVPEAGLNLENLFAVMFDGNVEGNYGVSYTGNFNVLVDNLAVVLKDGEESGLNLYDGADTAASTGITAMTHQKWYWYSNGINATVANTFNVSGDVDGDGDKELIITNQTTGAEGVWVKELMSITNANPNSINATDGSAMEGLQFDVLFTTDGKVNKEVSLDLRLTSIYGDYDYGANQSIVFTLNDYGYDLGNNWYRVTIPFSAFTTTATKEKTTTSTDPDTGADVVTVVYEGGIAANPAELKLIRFHTSEFSYDNTCVLACDNFRLVSDVETAGAVAPSATLKGANAVLNENFGLKYNANVVGVTDMYVDFDFNGETFRATGVAEDDKYVFDFNGIFAHQLAKPVTATLWALSEDGVLLKDVKADYSVKQNLKNLIENENSTAATKTLATDALIYAAAAQTYANIILPELITEGVDLSNASTTAFGATPLATVVNGEYTAQAAEWTGATLVLGNTIEVRFFLKTADTSAVNVTVSGVAAAGTVTEFTVYDEEKGIYYFDVPVLATEYDNVITVDLEGADTDGYYVNYSVNNYLAKKYVADPAEDAVNFNNLLLTIYKYGVSAAAY